MEGSAWPALQCNARATLEDPSSKLLTRPLTLKEINLISCGSMTHVSDIKLIRTDTTLDLSQKAEKGMLNSSSDRLLIAKVSLCRLSFNPCGTNLTCPGRCPIAQPAIFQKLHILLSLSSLDLLKNKNPFLADRLTVIFYKKDRAL